MKALKASQKFEDKCLNIKFTKNVHEFNFFSFDFVLMTFRHFKNSTMPFPGSLTEQPNKIIECFNVLQAIQNEEEEKIIKKQELLNKRKR